MDLVKAVLKFIWVIQESMVYIKDNTSFSLFSSHIRYKLLINYLLYIN